MMRFEDRDPLPAIPGDAPRRATRWRHIKTGEHYGVIGVAYVEATLELVVVYTRGGTIWTRPLAEFKSRFHEDNAPIVSSSL